MRSRLLRSSSSLALIPKAPAVATASQRAAQTLGHPNFALTMTRAEFKEKYTVKEIERDIRVSEYFRWCPFKKEFRSKDDFVNAQLFHSCEARYCKDAGNKTARASKTPSLEMNDKWIAWAAARLQIILIEAADVAAEDAADDVMLMEADEPADGAAEKDKSAEEDESDAAAVAKVKAKLPKWFGKCFMDDEGYIVAEMNVQKLIAHAERQDLPPQYLLAEAMVKHGIIIGVDECNEGDFAQLYEACGLAHLAVTEQPDAHADQLLDWVTDYKNGIQVNSNHFASVMEDDEEEQHPMSLEEVNAACLQEDLTLIMSTLGVTHDSFSIYKNVYQIEIDPHQGKYMALGTNENGVNICLGIFEMEHEAALAYARHIARKDKEDDEDDEDNEEEEEADRARKKTDEADRMAACSTARPAKGASRDPDAKGAAQKGVAKGAARKRAVQQRKKQRNRANMTDEQRGQAERDAAAAATAAKERMKPAVLDGFLANLLPALNEYDMNHTDGTTERDHNSHLFSWGDYEGRDEYPNAMWASARDNGVPSEERQNAAQADLALIDTYLKEGLSSEREKDGWTDEETCKKITLVKRIRHRLNLIVKGTAGFADMSRKSFRSHGCAQFVTDGSRFTCVQDSIITTARWLGVEVTKTQIYEDLVIPFQNVEIKIEDAVCYMREKLPLRVECLTHNTGPSKTPLGRMPGGEAYNLLRMTAGTFIVILRAEVDDTLTERHAVAYLADFEFPFQEGKYKGALIDNDRRIPIRHLEEVDRATPQAARSVIDSLFPDAKSVRITSVWQMSRIE
jgi:hypothetical protein